MQSPSSQKVPLKSKAPSSRLSPQEHLKEHFQELLPFKPISYDKDYEKKVIITHMLRTMPHLADLDFCFRLFRKNFHSDLYSFSEDVRYMLIDFITPHLSRHFHTLKPKAFVKKNLTLLKECFGLSEREIHILYAIYACAQVDRYYDEDPDYFDSCVLLGSILGIPTQKIQECLMPHMPLRKLGFLNTEYRDAWFDLETFVKRLMYEPSSKVALIGQIARIYPISTLSTDDFAYMKDDIHMLITYCKKAKNPSIYLYGKPGVGKNEIAALIAKELGRELWEIHNLTDNGEQKESHRGDQFVRAQHALNADRHMILLDECEGVFPGFSRGFSYTEGSVDKNKLNKMLESIRIPSIFLSNSGAIDPAFLRRFDIVLEVKSPPQAKKKELIEKHVKAQHIDLDAHIIQQISQSSLSQGVLLQACKVANTLASANKSSKAHASSSIARIKQAHTTRIKHTSTISPHTHKRDKDAITKSFLKVLNEHLKLQGEPLITAQKESMPYDMRLIRASMDIEQLCAQIMQAHSSMNDGFKHEGIGIRILAHGIAGSGKSAFAKALAKRLEKPIILKKASDLLSKWVGENEQNIASAFNEARAQGALLVFDEIDSFLQERSGANMGWEISMTNEMLTQMEGFNGIFIATTNRIDALDTASIRRFDMKIAFHPLCAARLKKAFLMYARYLNIRDARSFLSSQGARALEGLYNICLGDFALIARGARFSPIYSAQELYEKLHAESRIKGSLTDKRAGF